MNTINEKRRFNLIDLTILLVLLCVIAGTLLRLGIKYRKPDAPEQKEYEITFLVLSLPGEMQDGIAQGEEMFLGQAPIGTLKSVDFSRAVSYFSSADGTPVVSYSTAAYDVRCILNTKGVETEDGFLLLGETPLAPGQDITLLTHSMTASVLITDIVPIG